MNSDDVGAFIKKEKYFEFDEVTSTLPLPQREQFPSLNDEQWQAVSYNIQSRTQILAGPGTGKTRTLTSRVSYLLRLGVRPENIIVTTFTKKAATEMRERITQLGHDEATINRLKIGTFHYICFRLLKMFGKRIGLSPKVTIADTKDRNDLMKKLLQDPKLEQILETMAAKDHKRNHIKYKVMKGIKSFDVDHTTNRISDLMSKGITSRQYSTMANNNECLSVVYTSYMDLLTACEKVDFDTMLLYTVDLLKEHPQLVDNIQHLLVDEYQDTNPIQLQLIYLFAQKAHNVTVVGDPDQSIYGFRSADPENFDKMRSHYQDTQVLLLQKNYRSMHGILEVSTALIQQDKKRVSSERRLIGQMGIDKLKPVYMISEDDEYFESRFIAQNSKALVEKVGGLFTYSDIAVLVRSSARMRLIENELNKQAIPYVVVGGLRFWERHEIRVLVDYLRVIYSDFDNLALARVLNVPKRGIGEASIKLLKDHEQFGQMNMFQLLEYLADPMQEPGRIPLINGESFNLRPALKQSIVDFVHIIKFCRSILDDSSSNGQGQILEMLECLLSKLQFEKYLQETYADNCESRIENVKEISKQFEDLIKKADLKDGFDEFDDINDDPNHIKDTTDSSVTLLEQFFTTVNLNAAVDNSSDNTDKPAITVSTIHAAKGLEWPVVYVASCIQGVIPHQLSEDMAEERRILFVAMTRARVLLYVTGSFSGDQMQGWGPNATKGSHSSFLSEKLRSVMQTSIPKIAKDQVIELASILGRTPRFLPKDPIVTFSELQRSKGNQDYGRYNNSDRGKAAVKREYGGITITGNSGNPIYSPNGMSKVNGFKRPALSQDWKSKETQRSYVKSESAINHMTSSPKLPLSEDLTRTHSVYKRPHLSFSGNRSFNQPPRALSIPKATAPSIAIKSTAAIVVEEKIPTMVTSIVSSIITTTQPNVVPSNYPPESSAPKLSLSSSAGKISEPINSVNPVNKAPAYTPVRKPGVKRLGVRRTINISKPALKK